MSYGRSFLRIAWARQSLLNPFKRRRGLRDGAPARDISDRAPRRNRDRPWERRRDPLFRRTHVRLRARGHPRTRRGAATGAGPRATRRPCRTASSTTSFEPHAVQRARARQRLPAVTRPPPPLTGHVRRDVETINRTCPPLKLSGVWSPYNETCLEVSDSRAFHRSEAHGWPVSRPAK